MTTSPCSTARLAALALALALPAAALARNAPFATSVRPGLITATGSVGQNLLGSAAFGMLNPQPLPPKDYPPSPIFGFTDSAQLPTAIGIIKPPNPNIAGSLCRTGIEVGISEGLAVLRYDENVFPDGVPVGETDLSALLPSTSPCEHPPNPNAPAPYASALNPGLLTAFVSVGQNLLGTAVFGMVNPTPTVPTDPMRVEFAENSQVPVTIGILRNDTCQTYLALTIDNGVTTVQIDPTAAPDAFNATPQPADLSGDTPTLSQCPTPGT